MNFKETVNPSVNPTVTATTTSQRTTKVGVVSAVSVIVLAVASAIVGNPQIFSWKSGILVGIANMILVFLPNFFSKRTPNT